MPVDFVVTVESAAPLPQPEVFVGLDQNSDDMVTETELVAAKKTEPGQYAATRPVDDGVSGKLLWRVVVRGAAGSTYSAKVSAGGQTARGTGTVGRSGMGLLGGEVTVG